MSDLFGNHIVGFPMSQLISGNFFVFYGSPGIFKKQIFKGHAFL